MTPAMTHVLAFLIGAGATALLTWWWWPYLTNGTAPEDAGPDNIGEL